MSSRYIKSETLLKRAELTIPLGSQTFSKSRTQYPVGVSPLYIDKAEGCYCWDVDGNKYTDYVSGLASVTLGYLDPDVTSAVIKQASKGSIFSLPSPLEISVAEKIVEMVPCAEKVRFGKNGTDATSAGIRLSRAYTGKERVAVCGYHGWQDWYIGSTTRNIGVPKSVSSLTHSFAYNDIGSLEKLLDKYPGEFAAIIVEPMNTEEPKGDFLCKLRELSNTNNIVLIFDETITGFRFSNGGAQEYFNVVPDLATFGKGIANGYPLSAICGRAKIMDFMEKIFFSSTFGGELLSLSAALATMSKLQERPVISHIHEIGLYLFENLELLIHSIGCNDFINVSGHPSWIFLNIKPKNGYSIYEINTYILQEMFKRGILFLGTHNLTFSHTKSHIDDLIEVYSVVLRNLNDSIESNTLVNMLECVPLEPLFKVR